MEKNQWASYIGHLLIAMNEIDGMTLLIQKDIIGKEITRTWLKKSLSDRLKYLCEKIVADNLEKEKLLSLLREALELCPTRNLIAHGMFAVDARTVLQEGEKRSLLLCSHINADTIATKKEVIEATKRCIELSNDISECIAIIRMQNFRTLTTRTRQAHSA